MHRSTQKKELVNPIDLQFFAVVARAGSLSAAGRELGITTAAVSKHLKSMEARLGVSLLNRTTRRVSLTQEGEHYQEHARRVLAAIEDMELAMAESRFRPKGLLRINATLGFGRRRLAPLLSRFVRTYPDIAVQLHLSADPPLPTEDSFDVCLRFAEPNDQRLIARKIASNRRIICASPAYLAARGAPKTPRDLVDHTCISIRRGEEAYCLWRLTSGTGSRMVTESVKTNGSLSTNDGDVAVNWALEGLGIIMRGDWDLKDYVEAGQLVHLLPKWQTPDADLFAVFPPHSKSIIRVRTFVDFIEKAFA